MACTWILRALQVHKSSSSFTVGKSVDSHTKVAQCQRAEIKKGGEEEKKKKRKEREREREKKNLKETATAYLLDELYSLTEDNRHGTSLLDLAFSASFKQEILQVRTSRSLRIPRRNESKRNDDLRQMSIETLFKQTACFYKAEHCSRYHCISPREWLICSEWCSAQGRMEGLARTQQCQTGPKERRTLGPVRHTGNNYCPCNWAERINTRSLHAGDNYASAIEKFPVFFFPFFSCSYFLST